MQSAAQHMPHQSSESHRALEIGKAAEHLVCADLILSGYRAFLSDQGLPYDVIVDIQGRLIRIQVKSTVEPRRVLQRVDTYSPRYQFSVRRAGKGGKRVIHAAEFDMLALVALDIRQVAYMPIRNRVKQCVYLRPPGVEFNSCQQAKTNRCINEYPFEAALSEIPIV